MMRLSELATYAKDKHNIVEQSELAGFPDVSVLVAPESGKWLAILIRTYDQKTGEVAERCDIKCGRQDLSNFLEPWITLPFRMHGQDWIGVTFGEATKPEVVCQLFDRAVGFDRLQVCTIVLEPPGSNLGASYRATALPFNATAPREKEETVPKIQQMRLRYEEGDGSPRQRRRNFYRQGKFMEDYEDDYPWSGEESFYFRTYRELNTRQLRGYFSWRSQVRKGIYRKVCSAAAYLYLYELVNGIGVSSVDESLSKATEFETEYIDAGYGDPKMRENLRRWRFELAVLHGIAPERAREFVDERQWKMDAALSTLKLFKERSDQEVFDALQTLSDDQLASSLVVKKHGDEGIRLFAEAWRVAATNYRFYGEDLFTMCFGAPKKSSWNPLAGALYYQESPMPPRSYPLNECRRYVCQGDDWYEIGYCRRDFSQERLVGLLHETERLLRRYLKTGRPLKARRGSAWATPYVEAVIEADKKAKREAAKPKTSIRFDALEQIRREALVTLDRLLTDEDRRELAAAEAVDEPKRVMKAPTSPESVVSRSSSKVALDDELFQMTQALLRGESVRALIVAKRQMPEVVADALNEAFYDALGDSAVECDGADIRLVEDYRDDIRGLLEGAI